MMIHRFSFYSGRRTAFLPGRKIKHFGMPMRFSSGKGGVNALLALCLAGGMMLGAWLVSAAAGGQEDGFISYYASALLRARCTGTFWQVVSSSLFSSLCLAPSASVCVFLLWRTVRDRAAACRRRSLRRNERRAVWADGRKGRVCQCCALSSS